GRPGSTPAQLVKVGFVAQGTPVYAGLTVAEHLRLGARLNPRWDHGLARERIARLGLLPAHRAGRLSGGQRAQLALTLGLAKRPDLLILDEPAAFLDPLARHEFMQHLTEAAAEHRLSVVLSSHLVSDVERACDYLVVLVDSRVQIAGRNTSPSPTPRCCPTLSASRPLPACCPRRAPPSSPAPMWRPSSTST
ncbi:ATP-binding cassette domain-containing protein, partial [Nonomuraea sp. NPDC050202]|uniref:ATP-binding cassette domain-containing protein n=1 Tax=Nonomuraea sp. NPDC050202 TaxID=3155035 RepID=UPI0033D5C7BE